MLTVAKVTSSAAKGYAAYLDGRTRAAELGDYYLKDGERVEAPGRWVAGAQALGADESEAVSGDQLHALMAVRHPATGAPLRRVGGNGEAVAAIDATFSAPKSVSAAWALASPELRQAIERLHERAVDRALSYATQNVEMIRRRLDSKQVVHATTSELIATSWRHTTARAVKARPPDPQLHSHVLLHGAVRHDGEIVAIDSRSWFVHRRELGAAYRTHLAHELSKLGFEIQRGTGRGGRYFELAGIPAGLLDRWSSRHHQVQAAIEARLADKQAALKATVAGGGPDAREAAAALERLQRSGRLMPAEERYMASSTRAPKHQLATHGDLDRHWNQTAQRFGLDSLQVEALRAAERPLEVASSRELVQRLTEFDATFAAREARAVALEASAGVDVDQALLGLGRLRASGELLALQDGRYTTRPHRAAERDTIATAGRLAGARPTPLPTQLLEREALALDAELKAHGAGLSAEQREALALACSDRGLVIIEGQAGTGKSTTLTAIARAHQSDGRQIIITSTAALAAQRLAAELQAAGVTAAAHSTVALHAALDTGRLELGPRSTIIHDEAALASTREQRRLLDAVQASGARLILVGDPRQSRAVGAGGLWPYLEQAARDNGAHVRLTEIVRAQDPADRRDQTLFRSGQHERALAGYNARGYVKLAADQRQAEDAALDAAHADRQAGRRTLIIAQTSNEHLDQLNARAQAIPHQHGELSDHALPLTGRPYRLRPGDQIQLRHPIEHDQLGRLSNGTTGQVLDVAADHREATVRLDDGRRARLTQAQADQASVRLAYVQHPFPAQGQTADTTHLIVLEHATQEGCYVALTRARHATHIHAAHPHQELEQLELGQPTDQDPLLLLAEQMGRTEPELPSIRTPLAHEQHLAQQHAHEQQPAQQRSREPEPDHEPVSERELPERLEQAHAELAEARRALSYPAEHERAHQHALAAADRAAQDHAFRRRLADQLRDELDSLGPFARRGQRGRELPKYIGVSDRLAAEHHQTRQRLLDEAGHHQAIIDRWQQQLPDARQRLATAERVLDELKDQQARQRHQRLTKTLAPAPGPGHGHRHDTASRRDLQPEREPDDERERQLAERLEQARAELDDARRGLNSYPTGHERQHAYALENAARAAQARAVRQRHVDQLAQQLDALGPLARRGQPGRRLKEQIAGTTALIRHSQDDPARLRQDAEQHQAIIQQWERQHPDARQRLADAERAFDELADQQARQRLQHPGPHLTGSLGPAPGPGHRDHHTWQHAALAIERYRARYAIDPAEPTALGPEPEPTDHQQRDDREQAAIIALRARTNLGQRAHDLGPIEEQIRNTPHLGRQPPGLDRGHGLHL
jgi:conjugative relaxase-like TrwC/TraI family protein